MGADRKVKKRVKGVTKDSAAARQKIISAAIDLFARYGYKGASTESIAEQAGYGQATVFFHFNTKEGLLKACLEQKRHDLIEFSPAGAAPQGTIEALMEIDSRFVESSTQAFFSRILGDVLDNESIMPIYSEFHGQLRDLLSKELIHETGATKKDAEFAATALICMMIGVHIEFPVENKKFSRRKYTEMLALTGSLMIDHLQAAGSKKPKEKSKVSGLKRSKPKAREAVG